MHQGGVRVAVHRSPGVVVLQYNDEDLNVYCLVRPLKSATQIDAAVRVLERMRGTSWLARRRVLLLMRRLGRAWDGPRGVCWSNDLVSAISRARAILERLDLASVGPLEPEICDEYDDIIYAVMAKIATGGTQSLQEWVESTYEVDSNIDNGDALGGALRRVEVLLSNEMRVSDPDVGLGDAV